MAARPAPRPPLFEAVTRPFRQFFEMEASSGILLLLSALGALVWANSPWSHAYEALFEAPLSVGFGERAARFTVREAINDGLMAIFFLSVGMEIKRELVAGELRNWRSALLPLVAALGGMLVPALLFYALNRGGPGAGGWGIPVATDIAFAIGCLTLLKGRVPHALVVFLTALAIFDDIGGILVIALFYGTGLHLSWLLVAAAVAAVAWAGGRLHVRNGVFYLGCGVALWFALHHGGVHATISGVVLGMAVPAFALRPAHEVLSELHDFTGGLLRGRAPESLENEQLLVIEERLEDLEPPLTRFTHMLHGWVAFLIVPLFALANAGVSVRGMGLDQLLSPIPLGIILGLVVGKTVGIFGFSLLSVKAGLSPLPEGASVPQVFGVAVVGGIGFTVSLFIAQLAFPNAPELLAEAKLGVLLGSGMAAVLGMLLLRLMPVRVPQVVQAETRPSP